MCARCCCCCFSFLFVSIFKIYCVHRVVHIRSRLEQYEQACAIDSSTLKCAGHPSGCRTAILGILGTPLRSTCSCHNTDLVYECLGWYRLLWLNTCVGMSNVEYFVRFYSLLNEFIRFFSAHLDKIPFSFSFVVS